MPTDLRHPRRDFLRAGLGTGAALMIGGGGRLASAAESSGEDSSPNEKLNLAAIGTAARAAADIAGCRSENIVALCDIDADSLEKAGQTYRQARRYEDFRVMLEKESERIDGVIIGTPDHTHAPAAAMALRMGKPVYCEKPLTHTVYEARRLAELAAEHGCVTQMGNQIHSGDNYRRVVEIVESGTIGPVREVHVWVGVDYAGGRLVTDRPRPRHVNWDLWLGPAEKRPYVEAEIRGTPETVHPFHWRWFWDFGTGGLGDFGCHYIDLAHWALRLRHPTSIKASGPAVDPVATTSGLVVEYDYPARDEWPPVRLTWYDGGKRPAILDGLRHPVSGEPLNWGSGQLFVGERGMVLSNYGNHVLIPNASADELTPPEPYIPSSLGQHQEWIHAIKTDGQTTCNFDYAGALTEAVMLGVVAYRSGETLDWDGEDFRLNNSQAARDLLHKPYRQGWTL